MVTSAESRVVSILSRVRPFNTVHIRLRLHLEGRYNTFVRSQMQPLVMKHYKEAAKAMPSTTPRAYLRSHIHPYPGLGHQVSVWLAGFLWAKDLSLEYLGGSVTRNDGLLDLADEKLSNGKKRSNVVTVRLPPTSDERNESSLRILQGAISRAKLRYAEVDAIIFVLALDNPRYNQIPAATEVRRAMLSGSQARQICNRENDALLRVVVHIRRGDINESSQGSGTGLSRWISEEFYLDVIRNLREAVNLPNLNVDVVSLGTPAEFPKLGDMHNVQLHLNGDSAEDMVLLTSADILVAAPSSFSFTAALASKGAVLALYPWWHEIPDTGRWFRLDRAGGFDQTRLGHLLGDLSGTTHGS